MSIQSKILAASCGGFLLAACGSGTVPVAAIDEGPVSVDVDTIRDAADEEKLGLSDEAFKAMYGYGVATRIGQPDPVVEAGRGEANSDHISTLSSGEQQIFLDGLYGDDYRASFARTLEDENFTTTGGCTRIAIEQFFEEDELLDGYETPFDFYLNDDQRLIDAMAAWSGCMSTEGFEFSHPDQPRCSG